MRTEGTHNTHVEVELHARVVNQREEVRELVKLAAGSYEVEARWTRTRSLSVQPPPLLLALEPSPSDIVVSVMWVVE
jgi:hypothetical protein